MFVASIKLFSPKLLSSIKCERQLWWWTVLMFNKMDQERTRSLGYDRTCAEWLLKNGACVKFQGSSKLLCDYNILPPENSKFTVKEISADNAGINADGFDHLRGCEFIDSITLKNCSYIDDDALEKLVLRKNSLKYLELEKCENITGVGLDSLKVLTNLRTLVLKDLPYVKDIGAAEKSLKENLPQCNITIEK